MITKLCALELLVVKNHTLGNALNNGWAPLNRHSQLYTRQVKVRTIYEDVKQWRMVDKYRMFAYMQTAYRHELLCNVAAAATAGELHTWFPDDVVWIIFKYLQLYTFYFSFSLLYMTTVERQCSTDQLSGKLLTLFDYGISKSLFCPVPLRWVHLKIIITLPSLGLGHTVIRYSIDMAKKGVANNNDFCCFFKYNLVVLNFILDWQVYFTIFCV